MKRKFTLLLVLACFLLLFFSVPAFADCPHGFRRVRAKNPLIVIEVCVQSAQEAGYAPGESWAEYITESGAGIDVTWIIEWIDDPLPVSGFTSGQQVEFSPTPTPIPPTNTPVPPSPTPVIAKVTVAPTNPPRPTATAVPVVQVQGKSNKDPRESLSRVCVGFLSLAVIVLLIVWVVRSLKKELERDEEKRLRQTERRKREEEEARRDFRKYLRETEEALRQKPPNTHMASTAFEKARRLRAYATDKEKRKLRQIEKRLLGLGVGETK